MYKISIIVPVYNSEKQLKKCLDSLMYQTLSELEVIIVNDGSTDKSIKIINEYHKKFNSKIKVLSQPNKGQASARNLGIENASGEYIAFVDSDDFIELDAYETVYNYAKANQFDIVCFDFFEIINGKKQKSNYYSGIHPNDNTKKYILFETSPCNKIIKSNILKNNNIRFLENHIYEDFAMIPTLAKYTDRIGFLDLPLYNYVIRENSTMRMTKFNKKLYDIYDVMDFLYNNFSKTVYSAELEFLYIEHLLHGASLRFLEYKEGKLEISKISSIIKEKFPCWKKNPYYKSKNLKYKIICTLLFFNYTTLVKILLRKRGNK